jgi:predicted phage baseplate assembly protein
MAKRCGCTTTTCGCCEGVQVITPVAIENRPGLPAISFRVGTHGSFFETMKARLTTMKLSVTDVTGTNTQTLQPLLGLTARDTTDLSIALLDSWAVVADVLTFYQERLANEGYLRTATQRESILELARLVGYTLRPGVSASVFLAYTVSQNQTKPVLISAGNAVQSVPLQNTTETAQPFETSTDLTAQYAWNNLQVRLTQPQNITSQTIWNLNSVYVDPSTTLNKGDQLLFLFNQNGSGSFVRKVASVVNQAAQGNILVNLQPYPALLSQALPLLQTFVSQATQALSGDSNGSDKKLVAQATAILNDIPLGLQTDPSTWVPMLYADNGLQDPDESQAILSLWNTFANAIDALTGTTGGTVAITSPSQFVSDLLLPLQLQPRSSFFLPRTLNTITKTGSDLQPKLLINFAPPLADSLYQAWAGANLNATPVPLLALHALRSSAAAYGATAPQQATYSASTPGVPSMAWPALGPDEGPNLFYLDQPNESILPGSYALVQVKTPNAPTTRSIHLVTAIETGPRNQYGIGAKTTQLTFADNWWTLPDNGTVAALQGAYIYEQSEPIALVDQPIADPINNSDASIELDGVYEGLQSGMWVVFSGQRSDISAVTGVQAAELAMISAVTQSFNSSLPGDTLHTSIQTQTSRTYSYTRNSLSIFGNVVKATHGQTVTQLLGSGDGTQTYQSFTLSRPPLTYVSAPNASGVQSTLQVYVNNIQWQETDSFAGLGSKDQEFITQTDNSANTTILFGNGEQGARLPTGVQNVNTTYRTGIGSPGNVIAGQISMITTPILGVTGVNNPLDASGGADAEQIADARANVPLATTTLGRIVSLQDYADFARTFAGIGKAQVMQLSNGQQQVIYLTIAGADDIPIDPTSDLYLNLVAALENLGDTSLALQVDVYELVTLVLSANIQINSAYQWDLVAAQIQSTLLAQFGFGSRHLAQPALLCEVIAAIQNTPGVIYADVTAFGGIPEKSIGTTGPVLLTFDQIAQRVAQITGLNLKDSANGAPISTVGSSISKNRFSLTQFVAAQPGRLQQGYLCPAQLAIFTPSVPDTIVLSKIQ